MCNITKKVTGSRHSSIPGIFTTASLFLWGILCFACFTDLSFAQNTGAGETDHAAKRTVKGYVRDAETDEAIPFATVIVAGTHFGAATNSDGYFVIVNAPADSFTLKVVYVGYAPQEIFIGPTIDTGRPFNIRLKRETIELDGITVSQPVVQILEVPDVAGQVAISPVEITTLPNIGEVDVFRSLQLLPGISGISDGSSGLYVRGGTPGQNLVLFDGMKIYHVDHFFGFFSAFNADAIKDIRVYKGGFPAEFGGRTSSVVNLTGKTGDVNNLRYGMGLNLLSGHGIVEIPLGGKGAFLLSARRSYTDVVKSSLYNKLFDFLSGDNESGAPGFTPTGNGDNISTGTQSPDFYFYDINSKVTFSPNDRDILSLSIYNGRDNLDQFQELKGDLFGYRSSTTLFEDPDASLRTGQSTRWGNSGISGKWSRKLHDRLYSHLLVSYSTYFSKYNLSRDFTSISGTDSLKYLGGGTTIASEENNELKDLTVHLNNEWHLTNAHNLKLGFELSRLDVHYFATLNDTTSLVDRDTKALQGSCYLQDTWKLSRSVELTAGLRGTYYDKTGSPYLEPRASFVYSLSGNARIKGAWGRYYQFANRITNENILEGSRDFWILADDNLEPGYAEHWLLGIGCENEDYLLDLEGYYKDLDRVVEYSRRAAHNRPGPQAGFFQGTGFSRGIDCLVQKKSGRLTGWIGYSFGKVEYKIPEFNNGAPYPASHDRTHEVNVVAKYSLKDWDISATWVFASGKAYTVPESQYYLEMFDGGRQSYIHISDKNSYRLPAYHRLDLSISRSFKTRSAKYVLGFSIFNLYNNTNTWYRRFNLNTVPVAVTDVKMLKITPTVYFQIYSR